MLSWGYLIQRGQHKNRNCYEELSRVMNTRTKEFKDKSVVEDGDYSNDLKLVGRIVLNVWRLMRHEVFCCRICIRTNVSIINNFFLQMALQSYTFENILFHIMHQRAPQYSFQSLTEWWKNSLQRYLHCVSLFRKPSQTDRLWCDSRKCTVTHRCQLFNSGSRPYNELSNKRNQLKRCFSILKISYELKHLNLGTMTSLTWKYLFLFLKNYLLYHKCTR